jgi:hypothetical protein
MLIYHRNDQQLTPLPRRTCPGPHLHLPNPPNPIPGCSTCQQAPGTGQPAMDRAYCLLRWTFGHSDRPHTRRCVCSTITPSVWWWATVPTVTQFNALPALTLVAPTRLTLPSSDHTPSTCRNHHQTNSPAAPPPPVGPAFAEATIADISATSADDISELVRLYIPGMLNEWFTYYKYIQIFGNVEIISEKWEGKEDLMSLYSNTCPLHPTCQFPACRRSTASCQSWR